MRLTPSQIAVQLICGIPLPHGSGGALLDHIREGHDLLVRMTDEDFGYDLRAWHDHLKESREGGYAYGRNVILPRVMADALRSVEWQQAVRELTGHRRPQGK